jgi:hypothetical protein
VRAEELFREWYSLGAVRDGTARFWDRQLAHGDRYVTGIHLEARLKWLRT